MSDRDARAPFRINGWAVAGMLGVLLVGVAWQLVETRRLQAHGRRTETALVASGLEATLADAVISAQLGHYEVGRQRTSAFFTGLQRGLAPRLDAEHGGASADASRALLARRDSTVTALARSDPASAHVLLDLLAQYRALVAGAGLDSVPVVAPSADSLPPSPAP